MAFNARARSAVNSSEPFYMTINTTNLRAINTYSPVCRFGNVIPISNASGVGVVRNEPGLPRKLGHLDLESSRAMHEFRLGSACYSRHCTIISRLIFGTINSNCHYI